MNRRIFLITSSQMKVFEWHDKTLFSSYEFNNNDDGCSQLKEYLQSVQPLVSQVLVELLEEDFQRDKIPHVLGSDRASLISRQISRHYNGNKYTHARILGRETTGRKDDEVLLASIANEEPVDFWLQYLSKYSVPIAGIWSLPMISMAILKKLNIVDDNVLLVSRQMKTTLRESFFHEGKFYLSRQVKLDSSIFKKSRVLSYLTDGADQIHKFLTNQRIVPFGQKLKVISLMPGDLINDAMAIREDSSILTHSFIGLQSIFDAYGIRVDKNPEADVLFSYICADSSLRSDHYSNRYVKDNYYKHIMDRVIFYSSMIGSLIFFVLCAFLIVYSMEIDQEEKITSSSLTRIKVFYNENYAPHQLKVNAAQSIENSVVFVDTLNQYTRLAPHRFFYPLSSVFSQDRFARILLSSLNWERLHAEALKQVKNTIQEMMPIATNDEAPDGIIDDIEYDIEGNEIIDSSVVVTLLGSVNQDGFSYRDTVSLMNEFVEALESLEMVDTVTVMKKPVDVRNFSRFSDKGGIKLTSDDISIDADKYEVIMMLKSDDVKSMGDANESLLSGVQP